jgi:FtsH-binding integral membrane protein
MADSGLKEAIEGLDKLKFAMILNIVLIVIIVVAFIVAIFATVSTRSPVPLAVAVLLLASLAYPLWLAAVAYGKFHKAFPWRNSYRWAQLLSMVMAGLSVILSVVFSVWIASGWDPSPDPLMRVLGYFVGLAVAAVYAKAHMDLAEDTFTVYFKYFAVAEILAALFSFIEALSFVIGLVGLVLFFVAVREAREELLNQMLAGK